MKKILCALLFVLCAIGVYGQQQITGTIYEEVDGVKAPLPFANVFIPGTTRGATSDFDGNYTITVYENDTVIKVSYMGYNDVLKSFDLSSGDLTVDVVMSSSDAALQLDAVTVTAKKNLANENMLLLEQKKAVVVKESIGAKQMSDLGISDAAAATTRITGVNKSEESGNIYIRGLGDRYLSTTVNGLPVPSDNVDRKNIDLNLFSTDVIKNVGITKTYDVGTYADQASGAVDISSRSVAEELKLGLKGGFNTSVLDVMGSFRATQNSQDISFGFYNQPYTTANAIKEQSWNTVAGRFPLDYGMSLAWGKKVELFDRDLSFFLSASHSVSSEYRTGTFQNYRSNYLNECFDDVEEYLTEHSTTALLGVEYEFNDAHKLSFNSIEIFTTSDELYESGRNNTGYYFEQTPTSVGDSSIFVRDQNVVTTNLFINQLLGTHTINDNNTLTWGTAYNITNAGEPNRIRNVLSFPDDEVDFVWAGGFDQRKAFQEIKDNEVNGFLKDRIDLTDEDENGFSFDFGTNARYKTRDFSSGFYGVVAKTSTVESIDDLDPVLSNLSLYDDGTLKEKKISNVYDARMLAFAGFGSVTWAKDKISANLGLRYEYDELYVNWDVANTQPDDVTYNYENFLPSLNIKYQAQENNLFRLAASKTITLPEFKELAPFEYVAPSGRVTKGNPNLISSTNYNFDLKWEMYPRAKELISLTGFYKLIKDPINKSMERSSSGNYFYANTGEEATVYGLEFEGRVFLIKTTYDRPSLRFSLNATKMWFEQDLLDNFQYKGLKTSGLEGAADFILNTALSFSTNGETPFTATIAANYTSDKIFALGVPEDNTHSDTDYNDAIVEGALTTLDFISSYKLSDRISANFSVKNLLNPEVKQTQEIKPPTTGIARTEVVQSYKKGVKLSLGITINL